MTTPKIELHFRDNIERAAWGAAYVEYAHIGNREDAGTLADEMVLAMRERAAPSGSYEALENQYEALRKQVSNAVGALDPDNHEDMRLLAKEINYEHRNSPMDCGVSRARAFAIRLKAALTERGSR